MKFDVKTQICWLTMLISMCKENLYAKMEKLEAQICRCTRQGLSYALLRWQQQKRRYTIGTPDTSVHAVPHHPRVEMKQNEQQRATSNPYMTHFSVVQNRKRRKRIHSCLLYKIKMDQAIQISL